MKKFLVFVVIVAVVIIGWMALASQAKNSSAKADLVIKDQKKIYERVEAIEPNFYEDDYGITRVYGSVKNLSTDPCAYVKFQIEIRNKEQKLIKTLNITVKDIAPGGVKTYDVNSGEEIEGLQLVSKITEVGFQKR
ncbi:MAG: hypothetical protein K6T91_07725 [Firmicutes bacterium]|nr:hypothetical protein [Bacillota bacterium]